MCVGPFVMRCTSPRRMHHLRVAPPGARFTQARTHAHQVHSSTKQGHPLVQTPGSVLSGSPTDMWACS